MREPPLDFDALPLIDEPEDLPAASSPWKYYGLVALLFLASAIGLLSLFGDNIRALYVAQAGALAGTDRRVDVSSTRNGLDGDFSRLEIEDLSPPTRNRWERPFRGRDLRPIPRHAPVRALALDEGHGHRDEWVEAELARRRARAAREEQSVWRYEYPEGSIWRKLR